MKQKLGETSCIELLTGDDARAMTFGGGGPQGYALVLSDKVLHETVALDADEVQVLAIALLDHSAELKRELLRFVHFIESRGVLPAEITPYGERRGFLNQHYLSFEQLVDAAIEADQVDWYKLAQENGETGI